MTFHYKMCKPRRVTIVNLRDVIAKANENLKQSGSNYRYVLGNLNEHHAVHLYWKDTKGKDHCERLIEAGTPKECIATIYGHTNSIYGIRHEDPKT